MKKEYPEKWKLEILFWLNIICIFLPTYLAKGIANVNELIPDFTKYMWIYYLFLPIPVLSIILGLKYKKIVGQHTKNIISGIIITIIVIILGSFSFFFYDYERENYEQIIVLGEKHEINFPKKGKCNIKEGNIIYENSKIQSYGLVEFALGDTEKFEKEISEDTRWLKEIDNRLEILKSGLSFKSGNYHLFYNTDLNTYNEIPQDSGIYNIHYLSYNEETRILFITKYELMIN